MVLSAQLCSPEIDLLPKSQNPDKVAQKNQNYEEDDTVKYKSIESEFSEQELLAVRIFEFFLNIILKFK